jgi:hypothetical protein
VFLSSPEGLYQAIQVTSDCFANHTVLSSFLQLARSKGLGKTSDNNWFERGRLLRDVNLEQVWVICLPKTGQIGKPSEPDTSSLLVHLWLTTAGTGKLRKMEQIHKLISSGRGSI